ncbi:hypothetical protein AURDEDRAFT_128432 [Auricularia subglabra TFB-10046 SS5]|nr:hypothetical protein AURDEDRAFT_128432 [Auricularia subglabra TFB-10046 SS5]
MRNSSSSGANDDYSPDASSSCATPDADAYAVLAQSAQDANAAFALTTRLQLDVDLGNTLDIPPNIGVDDLFAHFPLDTFPPLRDVKNAVDDGSPGSVDIGATLAHEQNGSHGPFLTENGCDDRPLQHYRHAVPRLENDSMLQLQPIGDANGAFALDHGARDSLQSDSSGEPARLRQDYDGFALQPAQQPFLAQNGWYGQAQYNPSSAYPQTGFNFGNALQFNAGSANLLAPPPPPPSPTPPPFNHAAMGWHQPPSIGSYGPQFQPPTTMDAMEFNAWLAAPPPRSVGIPDRIPIRRRAGQRGRRPPSDAPPAIRQPSSSGPSVDAPLGNPNPPLEHAHPPGAFGFAPDLPMAHGYWAPVLGLDDAEQLRNPSAQGPPAMPTDTAFVQNNAQADRAAGHGRADQAPPRRGMKRARADEEQNDGPPLRGKKTRRAQRKPVAETSTPTRQVKTVTLDVPKYKGHIARVISAFSSAQDLPTADAPVAGPSNLGLDVHEHNNHSTRGEAQASGKRVHSTGTRVNGRMQLWDGPASQRPTPDPGERFTVNEPRPVGHDLYCKTCHEAGGCVYWQDHTKALTHVRKEHREGRPQRHEEERGKGWGSKRKKRPSPTDDEEERREDGGGDEERGSGNE